MQVPAVAALCPSACGRATAAFRPSKCRDFGADLCCCVAEVFNADPRHCSSQASVKRPAGGTRERVGRPVPGRSDGSAVVSQSVAMRERRAALHLARLEPGVGFWLAKQRWLWRRDQCA